MRVDESTPEQQMSSGSMGAAGASANGGQAFTGKAYHAANAPQELAAPDAGVGAGETEPTADAGDSDAARPWWITNANDAGTPSSSGAAGMTATGTGGAAGGTGGITGGSGGSGSDPSTGGTGGSSSSGTGGTGGTGGAPSTGSGGSRSTTPLIRCQINSGEPYAGQIFDCDPETIRIFPNVFMWWGSALDPNWDGSTPATSYNCNVTNAPPCKTGELCEIDVSSTNTIQKGICR